MNCMGLFFFLVCVWRNFYIPKSQDCQPDLHTIWKFLQEYVKVNKTVFTDWLNCSLRKTLSLRKLFLWLLVSTRHWCSKAKKFRTLSLTVWADSELKRICFVCMYLYMENFSLLNDISVCLKYSRCVTHPKKLFCNSSFTCNNSDLWCSLRCRLLNWLIFLLA